MRVLQRTLQPTAYGYACRIRVLLKYASEAYYKCGASPCSNPVCPLIGVILSWLPLDSLLFAGWRTT